jgi:hypothetical protein
VEDPLLQGTDCSLLVSLVGEGDLGDQRQAILGFRAAALDTPSCSKGVREETQRPNLGHHCFFKPDFLQCTKHPPPTHEG